MYIAVSRGRLDGLQDRQVNYWQYLTAYIVKAVKLLSRPGRRSPSGNTLRCGGVGDIY